MIARRRLDGGSGTVLVLGLGAVVLTLAAAFAALGAAVVARHRAESVADLAALAAAGAWPASDCSRAEPVAVRAGGHVLICRVLPDDSVVVAATTGVPRWLGAFVDEGPVAQARAGRPVRHRR